jgi:hypothetical protein
MISLKEQDAKSSELYEKARNVRGKPEYDAEHKAAFDYNFMPSLWIYVLVMELPSGCAATVSAQLEARIAGSAQLIPNRASLGYPRVIIWERTRWLTGPREGFTSRVIEEGSGAIKKFVNDWTDSQDE